MFRDIVKIILTIIGIYPLMIICKETFSSVRRLLNTTLCDHKWRYWKIQISCPEHDGINGTSLIKWRRCECCQKTQEIDTRPGKWKWINSYNEHLPMYTDTIYYDYKINGYLKRRESISDRRDKKIDQILNSI